MKLKNELRQLKAAAEQLTNYTKSFKEHEVDTTIKSIKLGKAAGLDEIHPELIKNTGPRTVI